MAGKRNKTDNTRAEGDGAEPQPLARIGKSRLCARGRLGAAMIASLMLVAGLVAAASIGLGVQVASAAQLTSAGTVALHWTAPANNGSAITGYIVTPYVGGSVGQTPIVFNSSATSEQIAGLASHVSYTFRVAAKNARGTGPASAASNAVTTT